MIDTTLFLKIKKNAMNEQEKAHHERMRCCVEQFAKELEVEPLSFALAMEAVGKKRKEDSRIWTSDEFDAEVRKVAKVLDKYIDHVDLDAIKIAILNGEDVSDAVTLKSKENK